MLYEYYPPPPPSAVTHPAVTHPRDNPSIALQFKCKYSICTSYCMPTAQCNKSCILKFCRHLDQGRGVEGALSQHHSTQGNHADAITLLDHMRCLLNSIICLNIPCTYLMPLYNKVQLLQGPRHLKVKNFAKISNNFTEI